MTERTTLVAPAVIRPLLEPRLPDWANARWFMDRGEAEALAPQAEIGWFDLYEKSDIAAVVAKAERLRWLNTIHAGIDFLPVELLAERGTVITNGAGVNAITIAEYVVMAMLIVAKGYDEVLRARDRHEWLGDSPGKLELAGTSALVLGTGAIGSLVKTRLEAFEVAVTMVRRTPGEGTLGPDEWRERLPGFDWIILALPATPETLGLIGAAELALMKTSAVLVNVARGEVVDQPALIRALEQGQIAGAFLDVMTPEPLPPDHPLWSAPNSHLTMHLSGRAQTKMFARSAERFLANLARWHAGEPLEHQVDLARGY